MALRPVERGLHFCRRGGPDSPTCVGDPRPRGGTSAVIALTGRTRAIQPRAAGLARRSKGPAGAPAGTGGKTGGKTGGAGRPQDPALRARLYDADGRDRDVVVTRALIARLKNHQLLWIDVDSRDPEQFGHVVAALDIPDRTAERILETSAHADLVRSRDSIHLTVEAIEADDNADDGYHLRELDILARRNVVVTVHDGPVAALEQFQDQLHGDTHIGQLDSGGFLAAVVDTVLTMYFGHIEEIERDIDKLDELAMRVPDSGVFLVEVLRLRRRVARLRRTIA